MFFRSVLRAAWLVEPDRDVVVLAARDDARRLARLLKPSGSNAFAGTRPVGSGS